MSRNTWSFDRQSGAIERHDGQTIGFVYDDEYGPLMASGPRLLAALKSVVERGTDSPLWMECEAAIAQAEGVTT